MIIEYGEVNRPDSHVTITSRDLGRTSDLLIDEDIKIGITDLTSYKSRMISSVQVGPDDKARMSFEGSQETITI